MPTRKLTRAIRRPRGVESQQPRPESESASLIDFLSVVQRKGVSLLPLSFHKGLEILGRGLAGAIQQSTADITTSLAFKEGVPSKREYDTEQDQDWYSLLTEIIILQHATIRENPHFVDLIGVSFYVEPTGRAEMWRAWPLLVTLKVNIGDLSTVLRGEQQDILTESTRLQLFAEIAEALHVLHSCGVAHGDIKPENILVETSEAEINCLLIDFGSSVIRGQIRLPTTDEPWSAPELDGQPRSLGFDEIAQTDLFACGLVLIHLLMPLQLLASRKICFIRQIGHAEEQWADIIGHIVSMKRTDGGETLGARILEIVEDCSISKDRKTILRSIVTSMICAKAGERSLPWDEILPHIKPFLSRSFEENAIEPVLAPPLAFNSPTHGHFDHITFSLAEALGELDDVDYVLRTNIHQDIHRKANSSVCEECKMDQAFQLAICHAIGFGCTRDVEHVQAWLTKSGKSQGHLDEAIDHISTIYRVPGKVERTVLDSFGIGVLVSAERTEDYQVSRRLKTAEKSLRDEIEARKAAFGEKHRCGAKLRSDLALALKAQGHLKTAQHYQQEAVDILTRYFGEQHPSPLLANIVLADILSEQGLLQQSVDLHQTVQPMLKEVFGPEHPETITALQILSNTLVWMGQYKEAEAICRNVVEMRTKVLARTHPLTLRAKFNLISVLRAQGMLLQASSIMQEVDEAFYDTLASDDLTRVHLNMVKAMLCKDLRLLDQAFECVVNVARAMDRLKLPEDDALRLSSLEVLASIHGAKEEWEKEEAVLRQVLHIKRFLGEANEQNREFYTTKCLLIDNLLLQSKLDEAEELAKQILETHIRSINDDPENFIACERVLAKVLSFRGESELAKVRYQDLLVSCKSQLGESHSLTLGVTFSLGNFFANEGKYNEAQLHYKAALQRLRHTSRLGKDAFKVARYLAIAYQETGQFKEALETCEEGIKWAADAVGDEHDETLDLYNVLADTYTQMGDVSKADDLYQTRLERQCQGSYLEIWVKDNMARLREAQGRHEEAVALKTEALRLLLLVHGEMHPDVLKMRDFLLQDKMSNGILTEEIVEEVLEYVQLKRKVFGQNHPSVLNTMSDLAYAYAANKRLDDSEKLFNQILGCDGAESIQSPQRYATILAKMAEVQFRKSNLEKAEELERKVLEIRLRTYGDGHRTVLLTMSNLASTLHTRDKNLEAESYLRIVVTGYENMAIDDGELVYRYLKSRIALAAVLYFQHDPEHLHEMLGLYRSTIEAAEKYGLPSSIVDVWKADLKHILHGISVTGTPTE